MHAPEIAAYVYIGLAAVAIAFQFALAMGAPWGELAMGGKYPGRYPFKLRVAAVVQMILLCVISVVVLIRAGLLLSEYFPASRYLIWLVVVFFGVGTILNTITPSRKERMLWGPVSFGLLLSSVVVATS